jgi:hypothetical protein
MKIGSTYAKIKCKEVLGLDSLKNKGRQQYTKPIVKWTSIKQ